MNTNAIVKRRSRNRRISNQKERKKKLRRIQLDEWKEAYAYFAVNCFILVLALG